MRMLALLEHRQSQRKKYTMCRKNPNTVQLTEESRKTLNNTGEKTRPSALRGNIQTLTSAQTVQSHMDHRSHTSCFLIYGVEAASAWHKRVWRHMNRHLELVLPQQRSHRWLSSRGGILALLQWPGERGLNASTLSRKPHLLIGTSNPHLHSLSPFLSWK